jgi:hypothetical protein
MDRFRFVVRPHRLAIARQAAGRPIPEWARGSFVTISQTPAELSVVCAQRHVPADVQQERDKVGLCIDGVVPMTSVGILAELCTALAAAKVPVFAISTYDTDYLLVSADKFAGAREALESLGHSIRGELPAD